MADESAEVATEPGPLWPDDVVAGARRAVVSRLASIRAGGVNGDERQVLVAGMLTSAATIATRAALNAPEVTAHLLAQHKDGYDSGVEAMRALSLASDEQGEGGDDGR